MSTRAASRHPARRCSRSPGRRDERSVCNRARAMSPPATTGVMLPHLLHAAYRSRATGFRCRSQPPTGVKLPAHQTRAGVASPSAARGTYIQTAWWSHPGASAARHTPLATSSAADQREPARAPRCARAIRRCVNQARASLPCCPQRYRLRPALPNAPSGWQSAQ